MKNQNFKIALYGVVLSLALVGCSTDDSVKNNNNTESGVLSNDEVTLTYGADLLSHYSDNQASNINFERVNSFSARSMSSIPTYPNPSTVGATVLNSSFNGNLNDAGVYHIPAGVIVTQSFNINSNANKLITLIIDGTLKGNVNANNGTTVIVSPTGKIASDSFQLNNDSQLKNWGVVSYGAGSSNGLIENNNVLKFPNTFNLNGGAVLTNNCKVEFAAYTHLNANLLNNSFVEFKGGFNINSNGAIKVISGSYTKISGGSISINGSGVVQNTSSSQTDYARIDFSDTTLQNMNASVCFKGALDINTHYSLAQLKAESTVVLNQDIFIAATECTLGAGTSVPTENPCNDANLSFTSISNFNYQRINGTFLSATDVKVKNGFAYVTYHTNDAADGNGNTPNGAIRVFDMSNSSNPILISQAEFNNAEFNGIDVTENMLYAVGNNRDGARLLVTPLVAKSFNNNDLSVFSTYKLLSSSAKNTFVYDNKLWYTSGKSNGGLFTLDLNNNFTQNTSISKNGAKYVANNATKQVFFAVEESGAFLKIANIDGTGAVEYNYPSLIQTVKDGKNVIAMDDAYVYVALSDKGVAKFNLANGEMVKHFEPNQYRISGSKVFKKNGATNGVAVDGCYVYLANGADGVIVLNKENFNPIGSFSVSSGSANFVSVSNGYLFVATGRDGLNYIKIN